MRRLLMAIARVRAAVRMRVATRMVPARLPRSRSMNAGVARKTNLQRASP